MRCKLYISHHCHHDAMHNAKDHPLCKHWKHFSAYDDHFDGLNIRADSIIQWLRVLPAPISLPVMTACDIRQDMFLKSMWIHANWNYLRPNNDEKGPHIRLIPMVLVQRSNSPCEYYTSPTLRNVLWRLTD